jgi:WD40 repeat protein
LISAAESGLEHVSTSYDGRWLVAAGQPKSLLVDLQNPSRRVPFGLGENLIGVSISPDDRWLAAGAFMGSGVTIWDAQTGQRARQLITNQNVQAAFSPDGKTLVSISDKEYALWDTGSWQPRKRVPLHLATISGGPVAFSRDGSLLAIAPDLRRIKLLNPRTGDELATLTAPEPRNLDCLSFSADAGILVAGTMDHLVHLWDIRALRRDLAQLGLDW